MNAGPPFEPVAARPAATLMLVRDGPQGALEVYLMRRPAASSFAPDAYVFPGGSLETADADPDLLSGDESFDLPGQAVQMGMSSDEGRSRCGAYHVAAVRELWEETGIFLGRYRGRQPPPVNGSLLLAAARRELVEGGDLRAVLERHSLRLALSELVYAAQFVSPPEYPKRFDVRFFLACAPEHQEATVNPAEALEGGWHEPAQILEADIRGDLKLMPPTRLMCHQLAQCASVEEAKATAPKWLPDR